jgi:hypothetical protein
MVAGRQSGFALVSAVAVSFLLVYPFLDVLLRRYELVYGFAGPDGGHDFGAYYVAARRFLRGLSLYPSPGSTTGAGAAIHHYARYSGAEALGLGSSVPPTDRPTVSPYVYPPVFVLAFVPFALFEFATAHLLWNLFSLALFWAGMVSLIEAHRGRRSWPERFLVLWLLVGFQPLLYTMKQGQVGAVLAALLCFAGVGAERSRQGRRGRAWAVASGAFTLLASVVKPFYATAGAHLLRDRERLLGATVAGVGVAGASVLLFGVEAHRRYLAILAWGKGWGTAVRSGPFGPVGYYPGYFDPLVLGGELSLVVRVALVLGVVGLVVAARRVDRPTDRATFALGLALLPLAAPVAYVVEFLALLVAAVPLLDVELSRERGVPALIPAAVLLLSVHAYGLKFLVFYLDDLLPALYRALAPVLPALQPGLWGTLLLFGLAAVRVGAPLLGR